MSNILVTSLSTTSGKGGAEGRASTRTDRPMSRGDEGWLPNNLWIEWVRGGEAVSEEPGLFVSVKVMSCGVSTEDEDDVAGTTVGAEVLLAI
jgi:hypothetical protein